MNNQEEGEMNLVQLSDLIGKPVFQLEVSDIILYRQAKLISRVQEAELIAELKAADKLWQTAIPGLKCADYLWG